MCEAQEELITARFPLVGASSNCFNTLIKSGSRLVRNPCGPSNPSVRLESSACTQCNFFGCAIEQGVRECASVRGSDAANEPKVPRKGIAPAERFLRIFDGFGVAAYRRAISSRQRSRPAAYLVIAVAAPVRVVTVPVPFIKFFKAK